MTTTIYQDEENTICMMDDMMDDDEEENLCYRFKKNNINIVLYQLNKPTHNLNIDFHQTNKYTHTKRNYKIAHKINCKFELMLYSTIKK